MSEYDHDHMICGIPCTKKEFEVLDKLEFPPYPNERMAVQGALDALRIKGKFIYDPATGKSTVFPHTEPTAAEPEYTGGSSSYYLVHVANPTAPGMPAYTAECNDIIEALKMNYAEGNAFKAIWRRRAAELGKLKKGYDNGLYDAEKVVFFGERMVVQAKAAKETPNV